MVFLLTDMWQKAGLGMEQGAGDRMRRLLETGVREGVFPGAVLLVAREGEICARHEVGHRALKPGPAPMQRETIFDLASLTKPLATTLAVMELVDEGNIGLDQTLGDTITQAGLKDKRDLTIRQLLSHSAGLVDWRPYYLKLIEEKPEERKRVLMEWIIKEPLAYKPGKKCLYSDLGFMLLEWVIGEATKVDLKQFVEQDFYQALALEKTFLYSAASKQQYPKDEFAVTEECPWRGRVIRGEVHDENAFAAGGHSGHAGLFGAADGVYGIVNMLRGHYRGERRDFFRPATVREFFRRQDLVPGCTWALGWDTPSEQGSSAGKYFSSNSVGHLGFTGTSVWMDMERDVIVILLTNRIHPTRNNDRIKAFRPKLHDTVMEELGID